MLSLSEIFEAQTKYGVGLTNSNNEVITYEMYLLECRRMLSDKTPLQFYNWSRKKQNDFTDNLIVMYVRNNLKDVEGFINKDGEVEQDKLMDRLRTDIVDFGILKYALEDDLIEEIQINDYRTIYVVKKGKKVPYMDSNGKPYQFVNNEELKATINRLIYTPSGNVPRMTATEPLLNARTANRGYRLSAVNNTAITPDMAVGFDFPVTSATIRKYSKRRLTFDDYEHLGTSVPIMNKFLKLAGRASLRILFAGATSSGKTSLMQTVLLELPESKRVILVQNPTEVMLYDRDPITGFNKRNVLHWEAIDDNDTAKSSTATPTMSNLIAHILRNTPDIGVPGEVRTPAECNQLIRIINTGHGAMSSLHADGAIEAIHRMADELATFGGTSQSHMRKLVSSFDIIVCPVKFGDGNRRISSICELTGQLDENGEPVVIELFRFVTTGEVDTNPEDEDDVYLVHGYFEQVSPISNKLKKKFNREGISDERLKEFLSVPKLKEHSSNIVEPEWYKKPDNLDS